MNTIIGVQSCSLSFPCYGCLIELKDLCTRAKLCDAPFRDINQMDAQAKIVEQASTVKELKTLAKNNDSIISTQMWKLSLDQVVLPVLHIILGITKKII